MNRAYMKLAEFLAACSQPELFRAFSENWLNEIIPGMDRLVDCDQGKFVHLEGNVALHTALVFENFRSVAKARFRREPKFIEMVGVLMHDSRKPDTREEQPDGGVAFPGHEAVAAQDVPAVAKRLGLSISDTDFLYYLVANHGEAHGFPTLGKERRDMLSLSPWFPSLALLQEADARSCILPGNTHLPVHWDSMMAGR